MTRKRIAVVGGEGYIGSYLIKNLAKETDYQIHSYDLGWFSNPDFIINKAEDMELSWKHENLSFWKHKRTSQPDVLFHHRRLLPFSQILEQYDVIIWAAGHSSVKMCDLDPDSAMRNNSHHFGIFLSALKELPNPPLVIYMSSSSVYGKISYGTEDLFIALHDCVSPYDKSMLSREFKAESYARNDHLKLIGLRLGTVCGFSPNQREELMVNSMIKSAKTDGVINISNPETRRAILYNKDLYNGIKVIIDDHFENCLQQEDCGIYNLSSYNGNVQLLAESVLKSYSHISGVNCRIVEFDETKSNYSFQMDTDKFLNRFPKFKQVKSYTPIYNMVQDIVSGYDNNDATIYGNRNETRKFEL